MQDGRHQVLWTDGIGCGDFHLGGGFADYLTHAQATGIAELMAPALGLDVEAALASPHVLVGSAGQCVETLLAWRERWGLTYIGLNEDAMVEFGPVVEALDGV